MDVTEDSHGKPEPKLSLRPIVVGVDESYDLEDFDQLPLSTEVRDQLAAVLRSTSADEMRDISRTILTIVVTMEMRLRTAVVKLQRDLINQQANNNIVATRTTEVLTRLMELEARIYQAHVKLPNTRLPRLDPLEPF